MKFTRIVSTIAVALLILLTGVAAVLALFGERLLTAAIERAGPALIGREVRVGSIAIDWGRHTAITATDLVISDVGWSNSPTMLRVRQARLTLDLVDALRLRLSPVTLGLQEPALHLARSTEGLWNLPQAGTEGGGERIGGGSVRINLAALRRAEIQGGELIVDDLASPGIEGRIVALSAHMPHGADSIGFHGTANQDGGTPIAFSGRTGSTAKLLASGQGGGEPFPVQLTVGPETSRLSAEGHLARPFDLAGVDLRIKGEGEDLAPLLAALAATPKIATPPFHLAAHVTNTEGVWSLRQVEARIGESEVHGEAAVSLAGGGRPRLTVDLVAPHIVPSDFGWLRMLGQEHEGAPSSLADARLPTAWLGQADGQGNLRVERLGGLAAGPASLRLAFELKERRLHLQPLRLDVGQGAVEGAATIEGSDAAPPRLGLRAEANGLQVGSLLAMLGIDQVSGTLTSASVDLRGQGTTWREVAAGLDGRVRFKVVDGSIGLASLSHMSMGLVETLGVALAGTGGGGATPMTCVLGDIPVRQGVAEAEQLVAVIPQMVIVGEGTARLGEATVHLTLTPKPLDEAILRVVVPVVIRGDLTTPEVTKSPEVRVGTQSAVVPDACG